MADKTDKIDHYGEAVGLRQLASIPAYAHQHENLLAAAQVHATLYLAEQQRYNNLIAFMVQYGTGDDNRSFIEFHGEIFREICEGIGMHD